jgi:hypothetical protein
MHCRKPETRKVVTIPGQREKHRKQNSAIHGGLLDYNTTVWLVGEYWCFGETCLIRIYSVYQTTRCHKPKDHNLIFHHYDTLKSYPEIMIMKMIMEIMKMMMLVVVITTK